MSEVTRAEQLANELERLACSMGGRHVLSIDAAKELRRLSAVEARCVELEKVLNTDTKLQGKLTATVIHQAALIQQAKEAMEGLNALGHVMAEYAYLDKGIGTSTTNGRAWLALRAALSAINEWEKSK